MATKKAVKRTVSFDNALKAISKQFTKYAVEGDYEKLNSAMVKLGLFNGAWTDIVGSDNEFLIAKRNGQMPETVQPRQIKQEALNVRKDISAAKKGSL